MNYRIIIFINIKNTVNSAKTRKSLHKQVSVLAGTPLATMVLQYFLPGNFLLPA